MAEPPTQSFREADAQPPADPTAPPPTAPLIGQRPGDLPAIPGYEIESRLTHGGMGVVYRGRQLALNRPVAVKMIRSLDDATTGQVLRFLAEAEAVAAVRHPNVVQVYECGRADRSPFLAIEFCSGGTLADRIRSPFSAQEAAELVEAVARGVQAAHDEGIVHRDLKPANVLFDAAGVPKVADFGLAKRAGHDLTATHAVMGTPAYMAPEQADGRARFVGPTTDVWALGAILHECLTGQPLFTGDNTQEILRKVSDARIVGPRAVRAEVPRELDQVCQKCLQREPHERYPSAAALADDLRRFRNGEAVLARPASSAVRTWKWAKRNRPLAGSLAAVVLVSTIGAAVSGYFAVQAGAREREATAHLRRAEASEREATTHRDRAEAGEREARSHLARATTSEVSFRALLDDSFPVWASHGRRQLKDINDANDALRKEWSAGRISRADFLNQRKERANELFEVFHRVVVLARREVGSGPGPVPDPVADALLIHCRFVANSAVSLHPHREPAREDFRRVRSAKPDRITADDFGWAAWLVNDLVWYGAEHQPRPASDERTEDLREAVGYAQTALRLDPNCAIAHYTLAVLLTDAQFEPARRATIVATGLPFEGLNRLDKWTDEAWFQAIDRHLQVATEHNTQMKFKPDYYVDHADITFRSAERMNATGAPPADVRARLDRAKALARTALDQLYDKPFEMHRLIGRADELLAELDTADPAGRLRAAGRAYTDALRQVEDDKSAKPKDRLSCAVGYARSLYQLAVQTPPAPDAPLGRTIAFLRATVDRPPGDQSAEAHYWLGKALWADGDLAAAEAAFRAAGRCPNAGSWRPTLLWEQSRLRQRTPTTFDDLMAEVKDRKTANQLPEDAATAIRGYADLRSGRRAEAVVRFEEAVLAADTALPTPGLAPQYQYTLAELVALWRRDQPSHLSPAQQQDYARRLQQAIDRYPWVMTAAERRTAQEEANALLTGRMVESAPPPRPGR